MAPRSVIRIARVHVSALEREQTGDRVTHGGVGSQPDLPLGRMRRAREHGLRHPTRHHQDPPTTLWYAEVDRVHHGPDMLVSEIRQALEKGVETWSPPFAQHPRDVLEGD